MSLSQRNLHDPITYWASLGSDGFGGYLYSTPALLRGRWTDKQVLFKEGDGNESVSRAFIYLSSNVVIGDYIACGDHRTVADPTASGAGLNGIDAHRVRQFIRTTNLRNTDIVRRAIV